MKYYAVKVGLTPGIYTTWDECQTQVKGYSGAIFKSFQTEEEAKQFLDSEQIANNIGNNSLDIIPVEPYAFVDGSYNQKTKTYGCGGFLVFNGTKHLVSDNGCDPELAEMRNVAGEILGAVNAVKLAIQFGIKTLNIYYDYQGIESWATGDWSTNKPGTEKYAKYMKDVMGSKISINFHKVKGHTGISGNEEADKLAKKAVGL